MWLNHLVLVLLTVVAAGVGISGQTHIFLDKTQTRVIAPSGSSLTLHCCLSTEKYERYRVSWSFSSHGPSFSNSGELCNKIINKPANSSNEGSENTHILSVVNETYSGWYFCKITVEIPSLTEIRSNGKEVLVSNIFQRRRRRRKGAKPCSGRSCSVPKKKRKFLLSSRYNRQQSCGSTEEQSVWTMAKRRA